MDYPVCVMDQNERIAKISAEASTTHIWETFNFRGKNERMPVTRLPIDLPIYRMKNGRTTVEQREYMREAGKPEGFFSAGEENQAAQSAQHKILVRMSRDEKGPVYQEMERAATQTESLLVTASGVVVNGNRRLAAMRDLFARDPHTFATFSHVDAKVLPESANMVDIETIESELQLVPETKLKYGWVERRLKLRYLLDELVVPRAKVRDMFRFKKDEDINRELQQLDLAEEYLEFSGAPEAYREVEQSEQIFQELQEALNGKTGHDADLRRLMAFRLIKNGPNLDNRIYHYRTVFGKDMESILEQLAQDLDIDLDSDKPVVCDTKDAQEVAHDPLAGIVESKPARYERIEAVLQDESVGADVVRRIANIHASIKQGQKDEETRTAALRYAQEANKMLHNIDISVTDPAAFPQIVAQLAAVAKRATQLLEEAQNALTKSTGRSN